MNLPYRDQRRIQDQMNEDATSATRKSGSGIGYLLLFALLGFVLYSVATYLPPQLDERYTGSGQVIGMVNPIGTPEYDGQYASINQDNANANLTNSQAEQKRASVWLVAMFGSALIFAIYSFLNRVMNAVERGMPGE